MRTGTQVALAAGDLLAGRYRLERAVTRAGHVELWRAADEVLARPVAVKIVTGLSANGTDPGRDIGPYLAAAGRASALSHPGLARVYDAAVDCRPGGDLAYVVSEWVNGQDLAAVLAEGPLEPGEAAALAAAAADAVAAAHQRGVWHGRLHPGNVMLTAQRRVRVTDVAVAAALAHGDAAGGDAARGDAARGAAAGGAAARGAAAGGDAADGAAADARDLSALLYAMLTARWPGELTPQPSRGTPAAPLTGGRTCGARQVRAAVPRDLDAVVARGLDLGRPGPLPVLQTPQALAGALGRVVDTHAARAAVRAPHPPSRLRRVLPWLAAVALLATIGTATYAAGRAVGALPRRPGDVETLAAPTTAPSDGTTGPSRRLDLAAAGVLVRDADPLGDRSENPDQVVNSFDGDTSTAWLTSTYRSAGFGGLKTGVGLLVDLHSPTAVARVDLGLATAGADIELRAADALGTGGTALPVVARQARAGRLVRLTPPAGTRARYWLVWFTSLPADGGGYRSGIIELAFRT